MSIQIALSRLRVPEHPGALLVVGPALGTSVTALWSACVDRLSADVAVLGWDLPGHGSSDPHDEPFTVSELAAAVKEATAEGRAEATGIVAHAGVGLGGAVGLALAIDHADCLDGVAAIGAGPRIGDPARWTERAARVRAAGQAGAADLGALVEVDGGSAPDAATFARCCEALAGYDVSAQVGEIDVPVLAMAGDSDDRVSTADATALAEATGGEFLELADVAALAPAEDPAGVAAALLAFLRGPVALAAI